MDILKASHDWAKAETLSNGLFVLFGLMFLAASFFIWSRGETDLTRAFAIPLLVAGGIMVILGAGLFYGTWTRAAGFDAAMSQDAAGFVTSEIARAEKTMVEYAFIAFKVMPIIIIVAAALVLFLQGPGWRAALITIIICLGLVLSIDSSAHARLNAYKTKLVSGASG